jgi:hypothetical protein
VVGGRWSLLAARLPICTSVPHIPLAHRSRASRRSAGPPLPLYLHPFIHTARGVYDHAVGRNRREDSDFPINRVRGQVAHGRDLASRLRRVQALLVSAALSADEGPLDVRFDTLHLSVVQNGSSVCHEKTRNNEHSAEGRTRF